MERCPPTLRLDDNRAEVKPASVVDVTVGKKERRVRKFYCDGCWEAWALKGNGLPIYWGGFVNQTWNLPCWEKSERLTRLQLYEKWLAGNVDLTWYCVPCYTKIHRCTAWEAVQKLNVYKNKAYRDKHTAKRRSLVHCSAPSRNLEPDYIEPMRKIDIGMALHGRVPVRLLQGVLTEP